MSKAIVSVVIPTFNHANFLRQALRSVFDQTFQDFEILVVDNHSTDDTDEVLNEISDSRLRVFKIDNKGIIGASRNLAIRWAIGEWVAFLDSDDMWRPEKLTICLEKLADGFDMVCHGERWFGEERDRDVLYGPLKKRAYQNLLFKKNCISTSASVVRREKLLQVGGFSERVDYVTAEDYDLWLKLAKAHCRIGFLPHILGDYRIHSHNESRSAIQNMNAIFSVVSDHTEQLIRKSFVARLRLRIREGIIFYGGARMLQAAGDHVDASHYYRKSLKRWPFNWRLYVAMLLNFCRWRAIR